MTSSRLPVLVIGAGPVGLLTALELARREVPVVVLESEPGTTLDLRAGTFHPPTLEMLQATGVTDAMLALGIRVPVWQSRDLQEGLIASWDLSVLAQDTPFPFRLHLEQHRLTPILLEMLRRHAHAEVRFGHAFTGLEQDEGGVTAIARAGDGPLVRIRGSWLVGADGGRSATRKAAGIAFEGYTWPERYTVISTPHDFAPLGYADNAYASDPTQWVALFRMPDQGPPGLWRMTLPVPVDMPDEQVLAPAFAQAAVARVLGDSAAGPVPIVHQSVYRVHQRVAANLRAGRVLLAGDSAHVNNPLGGFGLNSGIHDAVNLGEKLARVALGTADVELLDLYDRQRRTVNIEYVQNMSVRNKKNLEEADPHARAQRFQELRDIAASREKTRDYLLTTSMIKSIERANAIT